MSSGRELREDHLDSSCLLVTSSLGGGVWREEPGVGFAHADRAVQVAEACDGFGGGSPLEGSIQQTIGSERAVRRSARTASRARDWTWMFGDDSYFIAV